MVVGDFESWSVTGAQRNCAYINCIKELCLVGIDIVGYGHGLWPWPCIIRLATGDQLERGLP